MPSTSSISGSNPARDDKGIANSAAPSDDAVKLGLTIKEAAQTSGLSRSLLYVAIGEGKLRARKCRGRTVILRAELEEFLESLPPMKAVAA